MPLSQFTEEDVPTRLGVVRLWTSPGAGDANRPMVFAIPGVLSSIENIAALGENLGIFGEMCILRLPGALDIALTACAPTDLSALVGELLESRYPGRPVVLFGVSTGAVIALGVRAANLARIVAVEPPLLTGELWPVIGPLGDYLRQVADPVATALTSEAFGVSDTGFAARDHLGMLDGLSAPVDVVLADEPLQPQREASRYPSLVSEAVRRRLAATPGVRLHVVPGTGHNVVGQAIGSVADILEEACHRASARQPADRLRLDEPLLEATPLAARRLAHWGPDGEIFAAAFQASNPKAEVTVLGAIAQVDPPADPAAGFDALVLSRPAPSTTLGGLAAVLRPGGHLIARWTDEPQALRVALAPHGLVLREAVDTGGTGVLRAQKTGGDAPRPAMAVVVAPFARTLMDVRTRMPTRGLAADPELRVYYQRPPLKLPQLPRDAPKLLVLVRPAEMRPAPWRRLMADMIRDGWLVVLDFDDYPPLIAQVKGRPVTEHHMQMFWYPHAVQTSTPSLVEHFRPFNPETALFPNPAFDLSPFPQGPRPPRVFYGALIRGDYAVSVASSLAPAIESRPETEFVVIGDKEVFAALPTANKRYYDYMSFEAYLRLMSECTVSLSPVEDVAHWNTKSDGKFVDAARAGVLTIGSRVVYEGVIRHGANGLMARGADEWAPLLRQALTDEPARERMARAAWDYVRGERMFADQEVLRRDWYRDLWALREELNAAVMARVPGLREAIAG